MVKLPEKALAAALTLLTVASAASPGWVYARAAGAKAVSVYLVVGISSDPFYLTLKRGAEREAAKFGYTVLYGGSPTAASVPGQIDVLNTVIARKPDFILIAPIDPIALVVPLLRAQAAGIHVITVATRTYMDSRLAITNVSSESVLDGRVAAATVAALVRGHGVVAAIGESPGSGMTADRQMGFTSGIKAYRKIAFIGTRFCRDAIPVATSITQSFLTRRKGVAGIVAMDSVCGDGVSRALGGAISNGRLKRGQVKLVEFDAEPRQLADLRKGTVDALIAQDPRDIGKVAIDMVHTYVLHGARHIPKHYGTGAFIITRANMNTSAAIRHEYQP